MADQKQKEVLELHVPTTLKSLIEALVFAAREPLTVKQLRDIYEGDGPQSYLRQLDTEEVEAAVNELNAEYDKGEKPYRIIRIAGGFQFATLASYAEWIGRLYKEQGRRKLSQSGIETLAIIAYKQPVTKADIESIRGVNCDYVLGTLLEKELATVVGRAHAPGRPLLYGTTREFLKHFGLNEITDLPRPREIEEILGESQFETERRMLESQAGAETMKDEAPEFKSRLPHIPKKKAGLETPVEIKPKDGQRTIRTVQQLNLQEEVNAPPPSPASAETVTAEPPAAKDPNAGLPPVEPPISEAENSSAPEPLPENVSTEMIEPAGIDTPATAAFAEREPELPIGRPGPGDKELTPEVEKMDVVSRAEEHQDTAIDVPVLTVQSPPVELPRESVMTPEVTPAPGLEDVHKSRWQSWKEKVQGFIRKIFG